MRFRYYFVVQDAQGNVISNAAISVYLAGTTTPAVVYATMVSQQGVNSTPQLYSRENGSVVFWVDSNDYSYGQLFDIVVQKDTFNLTLSDVQIIVWDAVNAVNATNATHASNSDKLGGYDGSYYLNRANHTGTQPPNTISPQGSGSGLSADNVDGFDASLTPGPNIIVPLNASGILDLSLTSALINTYTIRRINGDNLTSDYPLAVGEEAIYKWDTTASLSKPLRIATVEGLYLLIIRAPYQTASDITGALNPNNTTYSNAITRTLIGFQDGASGYGGNTSTNSYFDLINATSGGITICFISTFTNGKCMDAIQRIIRYSGGGAEHHFGARWNDTTTAWTSLGTLTTSAANGTINILVRRLA